ARFYLDGKQADAEKSFGKDRLIRVLKAQPLTISAFTNDAVLPHEEFASDLIGTRAGFLSETNSDEHTIKSLMKGGWKEAKRSGGRGLLDGQFMWDKSPVTQTGNQVVAFCYRNSTEKCNFLIGRSKAMGLVDGEIVKVDDKSVTVRVYLQLTERTWKLDSDTQYRINGQDVVGASELKPGMKVTVFERRPQVVDTWTMPPVAVPEDQQFILYGVDGKKSIIKDGRLPNRIQAGLDKKGKK
ncbi:MAG: hypothetical protein MI757_09250, partial [Pirellulales bacterium]|nr:hypothetical protein [Pirellulales bacterium]